MIKPTHEKTFYSSLVRLQTNEDFKLFIDWLKTNLDEQDINNRTLQDIPLHRGQGASLTLADILSKVKDANEVVKHLNR